MELVQEGRLHGDNPSEEDERDPLDRPAVEPPAEDDAPGAPAVEPEDRDEPEPKGSRSQVRPYVVAERLTFEEDGEFYFVEVGTYDARNAESAKRKAFKEHVTDDEPHDYMAVPMTYWNVTPVRRAHRKVESVQVG